MGVHGGATLLRSEIDAPQAIEMMANVPDGAPHQWSVRLKLLSSSNGGDDGA
jgi:hypothetical protein